MQPFSEPIATTSPTEKRNKKKNKNQTGGVRNLIEIRINEETTLIKSNAVQWSCAHPYSCHKFATFGAQHQQMTGRGANSQSTAKRMECKRNALKIDGHSPNEFVLSPQNDRFVHASGSKQFVFRMHR